MPELEKERLNLYVSKDLLTRLKFCSDRFGVSRSQMAVMLIGQGVASIEEGFKLSEKISNEVLENNK